MLSPWYQVLNLKTLMVLDSGWSTSLFHKKEVINHGQYGAIVPSAEDQEMEVKYTKGKTFIAGW